MRKRLQYQMMIDRLLLRPGRHLRGESRRYRRQVILSTCFWRNEPQLRALSTQIAPHLVASGRRSLRVAVHAGSVGCEALSLLLACEQFDFEHPLDVYSFDIDKRAIAVGRRGVFNVQHFRDPGDPNRYLIPGPLLERNFRGDRTGQQSINSQLLRAIKFRHCDMTDARTLQKYGQFDLIACQNALLHLTPQAALTSLVNLRESLTPGGALLLGGTHPDMLVELTKACRLAPIHMDNRAVYDSWSNRQAMWHRNPDDHLALEPYNENHPDRDRRYGHVFVREEDAGAWAHTLAAAA